jgi:hypothetical protein
MFKKQFLIFALLSISLSKIYAQQWWYGTFTNICDNREFFSNYSTSQTILGARINAGSGFEVDTVHQIFVGLNYMIEYGHKPFSNPIPDNVTASPNTAWNPVVDLYYKYEINNYRMFFGSFPRLKILNYPLILLTDTLEYYKPNIQGAFMEISGSWGKQNVWCDWVSRQTLVAREQFIAGTSGHFELNNVYLENYMYMYHNARSMTIDTTHLQDNGCGAVYLGIDLNKKTPLNTLKFDAGFVGAYDRRRPDPYGFFGGFQIRSFMNYKFAGIDATYYKGKKLPLVYGDPFYRNTGNYARIDAYIQPLRSKRIESKIGWSFHILDGGKFFDNSFQVMFRVNFLDRKI